MVERHYIIYFTSTFYSRRVGFHGGLSYMWIGGSAGRRTISRRVVCHVERDLFCFRRQEI